MQLLVEVVLFQVGQEDGEAANPGASFGVGIGPDIGRSILDVGAVVTGGQLAKIGVVVVGSDADLPEVTGALHFVGSFADFLNGWEEQGHEQRNDGDDDEEFDESEGVSSRMTAHGNVPVKDKIGRSIR